MEELASPSIVSDSSLGELEFVAFDLETTGLHRVASQIIEIGAVRFRGDGTELGRFQQLVNPCCRIPWAAMRIHGITDRMVQGEPILAEMLPRFLEFLGPPETTLLAHNAHFDVGFLSVAFGRTQQAAPSHAIADTCALARRRLRLPNYRLQTLGEMLQLPGSARHRALDDALVVKEAFLRLARWPPMLTSLDGLWKLVKKLSFTSRTIQGDPTTAEMSELQKAMNERRPVTIRYGGGSAPGTLRKITPLRYSPTGGVVYLKAWCHQDDREKTFRLDRVQAAIAGE